MAKQEEFNHNPPALLHQTAHLDVFLNRQFIEGSTTLWLTYNESLNTNDILRLHCRQCTITEVTVNSIPAEWELRDALQNVLPGKKRETYGGVIDGFYRLALEVAREGELQIKMPSLVNSQWTPPTPLSSTVTNKEVIHRQRRLRLLYEQLVRKSVLLCAVSGGVAGSSRYDVEDEEEDDKEEIKLKENASEGHDTGLADQSSTTTQTPKPSGATRTPAVAAAAPRREVYLAQVTIKYHIALSQETTLTQPRGALVFRKESAFARKFDKQQRMQSTTHSGREKDDKEKDKETTMCVYTQSCTQQMLRDVDGVRTWLPCLDFLDQRASFDILIRAAHNVSVACVGVKIQETMDSHGKRSSLAIPQESGSTRVSHRFFLAQRVPVCQVGFFAGRAEKYTQCLSEEKDHQDPAAHTTNSRSRRAADSLSQGVHANVWVATGLCDFRSAPLERESSSHTQEPRVKERGRERSGSLTSTQPAVTISEGAHTQTQDENESNTTHAHKRMRVGDATVVTANVDKPLTQTQTQAQAQAQPSVLTKRSSSDMMHGWKEQRYRRLYEHRVQHTLLGFDISFKLLQKFTGHRYTHRRLTIVFVHELGSDFCVYEGLILMDAKYLHDHNQVHMESPTNMTLTLAFLYCWLRGALPLSSYEEEFLLHGLTHYLLSFYTEEVFGPTAAQYFLQKKIDICLSLEKQGHGAPLSLSLSAQKHNVWERYEIFSPQYAEYCQSKACVLFVWLEQRIGGKDCMRLALRELLKSPLLFKSPVFSGVNVTSQTLLAHWEDSVPSPALSPAYSESTPTSGDRFVVEMVSPSPTLSPNTHTQTHNNTLAPPSSTPVVSAQPPGSFTPYRGGISPWVDRTGALSPSYHSPALSYGQLSPLSVSSGGRENGVFLGQLPLRDECLSASTFLLIVQRASDSPTDLDERFLEQYVFQSGLLFLRVSLGVTERSGTKPRQIRFATDQLGLRQGTGEIDKSLCLDREVDTILIEDRDDNLSTPTLHFSVSRREQEQAEFVRPGRSSKKVAEFPVKCLFVDPLMNFIGETRIVCRDVAHVGQLLFDYSSKALEKRRLNYQFQALRGLALSAEKPHAITHTPIDNTTQPSHTTPTASTQQSTQHTQQHTQQQQQQQPKTLAARLLAEKSGTSLSSTHPPAHSKAPSFGSTSPHTTPHNSLTQSTASRVYPQAVHRLFECVLGSLRQNENDTTTLSLYVRAEAALALAHWQNEHAPLSVSISPQTNDGWPGMFALCEALTELYVEPRTHTPRSVSLAEEGAVFLRDSLLTALSLCRSRDGHTPWEVCEMLLLFAEELVSEDDDKGAKAQSLDNSHYIAVVLLALSRLRFADIDLFSSNKSHALPRVVSIAQEVIDTEFTASRSRARIALTPGDSNTLPSLNGNGVHIAAALTCLSEMDIQVTRFVTLKFDDQYAKYTRLIEDVMMMPLSIYTKTPFMEYFLSPNTSLFTVYRAAQTQPSRNAGSQSLSRSLESIRKDLDFFLCNSVVRAAAYEAFTRLTFAMHVSHVERAAHRLDLNKRKSTLQGTEDRDPHNDGPAVSGEDGACFIPAAMEALETLCKREGNAWVVQQCTLIFCDALVDAPPRITQSALSLNLSFFSILSHDGAGYCVPHYLPHYVCYKERDTFDFQMSFHHNPRLHILQRNKSKKVTLCLNTIYSNFTKLGMYNQPLRTLMLRLWRFIFGDKAPPSRAVDGASVSIAPPSQYRDILMQALQSARAHGAVFTASPSVSNPYVSWLKIEEWMKHRNTDKSSSGDDASHKTSKSVKLGI